jgi:hypothetical protein
MLPYKNILLFSTTIANKVGTTPTVILPFKIIVYRSNESIIFFKLPLVLRNLMWWCIIFGCNLHVGIAMCLWAPIVILAFIINLLLAASEVKRVV